jgi:hypothetical protein
LYLSSRLGKLRPAEIVTPWPAPRDLEVLVTKADKLFIYAATVVKFIENPQWCDPQQQLERLLSPAKANANAGSSPWRDLDDMYRKVLNDALAIEDQVDEDLVTRFKAVMGATILLRSPLSVTSLEALLEMPKQAILPSVVPGVSLAAMRPGPFLHR